jgi:hypothetical protein
MRRLITTVFLLAALATPVVAAEVSIFVTLTVSTMAVGLTNDQINPPGRALQPNTCSLTVEDADVRYRWSDDNTAPTASVGQLLTDGQTISIGSHEDADRIQFIRAGDSDATIQGHCWRQGRT